MPAACSGTGRSAGNRDKGRVRSRWGSNASMVRHQLSRWLSLISPRYGAGKEADTGTASRPHLARGIVREQTGRGSLRCILSVDVGSPSANHWEAVCFEASAADFERGILTFILSSTK